MPKLRNATTAIGAMTQYLARKCVIHSPQAELDVVIGSAAHDKMPRFGKNKKHERSAVHMLAERGSASEPTSFLVVSPKGRAMKVTVEEVAMSDMEPGLFRAVGD